ncbi:MAG: flagellar hook-associated protein FlgK [Pseudomonadota bacterium]
MSLSASLNTALAGLGLSSRRAEVIASNVANADTPGYARRRLLAGGVGLGPIGGASVGRDVSPQLQALRRDAQSGAANASVGQSFTARVDQLLGDPGDPGSLQDMLNRFDAALTAASTDPASDTRLAGLSQASQGIVDKVNSVAQGILSQRQQADTEIGRTVENLNTDLQSIEKLNTDIQRVKAHGQNPSTLMDQRQVLVDRVSSQIPVRQLTRDNDRVALVSTGGIMLLDGPAAELTFTPRAPITAEMVVGTHLSGLQINGKPVNVTGAHGQVSGGRLSALFSVRDESAPTAMARLDAFALELATRFQDPAVDPSLPAGDAGLFTDRGAAADASNVTGLSLRMSLNPDARPESAATHWKFRDGFGATIAGPTTSGAQLQRFSDAISSVQTSADTTVSSAPSDLTGFAASLRSLASSDRITAEDTYTRKQASADTLAAMRDGGKVDIDAEMRRLIEVEQAYAANARLIQAVDQMMNRLSEL